MEQLLTVYGGAMLKGFFVTLFLLGSTLFLHRWYRWQRNDAHHTPSRVSRFGGGALILGFLLVLWQSAIPSFPNSWWIFSGVLIAILLVGFVDDSISLHWGYQLAAQLGFLGVLYFGGLKIAHIIHPAGGVLQFTEGGAAAAGFFLFLFWGILLFNTVNWLDGIDGLCASVMAVTYGTLFFLTLSPTVYQPAIAILLAIAFGGTMAFLLYNYPPAKIMAGTSGSLFFGGIIIFVSVVAGTKIATTLLVLALPITDTFFVLLKRFMRGSSLFAPDQGHLHHILQRNGWSDTSIVLLYTSITLCIGSIALVTQALGKFVALIVVFSLLGGMLGVFHFSRIHFQKWGPWAGGVLIILLICFLGTYMSVKETRNAVINGQWYVLAVADTPEEHERGLSNTDALCMHCGMLFIFPEPTNAQFWMKDMRYSLDILWIRENRVVAKHENLPFPSREVFGPGQAVTQVIELPAGSAHDISVGTKIYFW